MKFLESNMSFRLRKHPWLRNLKRLPEVRRAGSHIRVPEMLYNSNASKQDKSLPAPEQKTMSAPTTALTAPEVGLPNDKTLKHAARLAIEQDKPVMFDYYIDTRDAKAFLGEDAATKEKMLVRSEEEYTSPIQKIFKVAEDFIVITENSIYIISGATKKKTISAPSA